MQGKDPVPGLKGCNEFLQLRPPGVDAIVAARQRADRYQPV